MTDLNLNRTIVEQRRTLKGFNRKMELLQAENRKLREERDSHHRVSLRAMEELQAQQREQKLIEGLRTMVMSDDKWYVGMVPIQEFAERLLIEIGVTE